LGLRKPILAPDAWQAVQGWSGAGRRKFISMIAGCRKIV
jgi:hypothetical protein